MMLLLLVGVVVTTLIPIALTFYFFANLYVTVAFAGWEVVKSELVMVSVCFLGLVLSWVFWWFVVGTHINIKIGVS